MKTRVEAVGRLNESMASLYGSGDYFVRIPAAPPSDSDGEYWGTTVDPDGNVRNRLGERDLILADLGKELAFVRTLEPGTVLDAGCGPGYLLDAVGDEWERFGLEVSARAVEHARRFGDVRLASLEECPFPDAAFDLVVCHHVIEHVADPIAAIRQIHRVCRPGGRLVIATPDFDSAMARRFGPRYRLLHDGTHISLFSNDSMHRFLRDHGFAIDGVDYPFFATRHGTAEALLAALDVDAAVSPPFPGNFMTFYCTRV